MNAQQLAVAFVTGALFAAGLAISGMTQPQNILAFLDLQHWNPALIFVMASAVLVYSIAFRWITRRAAPVLGGKFELPTSKAITLRLVAGAALFGIGWGIGGFCGGPAIASLAAGSIDVVVFVLAMAAGMRLCQLLTPG